MEQGFNVIQEYLAILKRYIFHILGIGILGFVLSSVIASRLPSIYTSTATILIEPQEIPQDLVMSIVTDYAEQRLQIINQKLMSSANLMKIIEKFDLYREEKLAGQAMQSLINRMRDEIKMSMIGGKTVIDPKTGRAVQPTLAFTLSFESQSPQLAQQVANELVDLYLNQNKEQRIEVVEGATSFIEQETDKLSTEINVLENRLAAFKEVNAANLPELNALNMQRKYDIERQIAELNIKIVALTESELFLRNQLAQLNPIQGVGDQLAALKAQYAIAASKYSEQHPDIKRLKTEIANLEKNTQLPTAVEPDIVRSQEYIQTETRLIATQTELRETKKAREALQLKLLDYQELIAKAPQVEQEYQKLTRDYENAIQKYRELKAKQREVTMAQTMEVSKSRDEFMLLEPPLLPETPSKPNRKAIKLLGLLLSVAVAIGYITIKESFHPTVYTASRLSSIVGMMPLVVIPDLEAEQKIASKRQRMIFIAIGGVVLVVIYWLVTRGTVAS